MKIFRKNLKKHLRYGAVYERKLKSVSDQPRSLRIDALSAGQASLAYGLEFAEVAKKDRGRIFSGFI